MTTRERIMVEALDLFAERGYGETSLREIAEQLGITKAAVYYHFKTKDDILNGLLDSMMAEIDDTIAWAKTQPSTRETRVEIIQRYCAGVRRAGKLMRFLQENQTSLRHIDAGMRFKERMRGLGDLLAGPDADLHRRLRVVATIMVMHAGWMLREEFASSDEEMAAAIVDVAEELAG